MKLLDTLTLERCPHCRVSLPLLRRQNFFDFHSPQGGQRRWHVYACASCGGLVAGSSTPNSEQATQIIPSNASQTGVDESVPAKPREYLRQAMESTTAPAGAVMLAASCVDAMLKDKGYAKGSLYARIDEATKAHLITPEMAKWAHQIRLDANDQRHADEITDLPNHVDAARSIEFAQALAQFLYVLPSRVTRGLAASAGETAS